jgi:hypothetical protein
MRELLQPRQTRRRRRHRRAPAPRFPSRQVSGPRSPRRLEHLARVGGFLGAELARFREFLGAELARFREFRSRRCPTGIQVRASRASFLGFSRR